MCLIQKNEISYRMITFLNPFALLHNKNLPAVSAALARGTLTVFTGTKLLFIRVRKLIQ